MPTRTLSADVPGSPTAATTVTAVASAAARKPRGKLRRTSADGDSGRVTLTPDTWIDAATQVLVDQGIDHVRVDVLATQLGVTRGSFYWHFRDREDLLRRVLQAWRTRATDALTRRLTVAQGNPQAQLRDVISLPHRGRAAAQAARIELAIRAWARRDAMAREALDEADASRIDYHRQIFAALGFAPEEARLRAFTLYSCEVAESLLHRQGSQADRKARQQFLERLMQTPLRTA
jgi:AcrR family transcriptional regulator